MSKHTEHATDHTMEVSQNKQAVEETPTSENGWSPHPDLTEEEAASIHVSITFVLLSKENVC
jgi:hypothetical protein